VDDGTFVSKLNMVNHVDTIITDGGTIRRKQDIATENVFRRTVSRAEAQGMRVNVQKTGMIAIHDSMSYVPEAYIKTTEGEEIASTSNSLKVVGFNFDSRPDASFHVEQTVSKVRRRYWVIRHLQRLGFDKADLVKVYTSILRSAIEFCSVVYGPLLTKDQEEDIERLQSQSLKIIYGFDKPYREILEETGLQTLKERRAAAVLKFAQKSLEGKYAHWFPLNEPKRATRHALTYREEYARCERLRKTPIYHMRRVLNGRE
jgi:hypothetical protein